MSRRGPKPKHPALKLLAGNPGRRPAAANRRGRVRKGIPPRPPELTGEAAAEWDRLAPELAVADLLAVTDRGILAAYCLAVADLLAARNEINQCGRFVRQPVQTSKGRVLGEVVREHPAVKMQANASARVAKLAEVLGITAASRARLEGDGPAEAPAGNKVQAIRERIQQARS